MGSGIFYLALFCLALTYFNFSCGHTDEYIYLQPDPSSNHSQWDNITDPCDAFFHAYIEAAENFTQCELLNARPFRICIQCVKPYAYMKSLYNDLTTIPSLDECMIKFLKSDRVQVIPTLQKSVEELWTVSYCDNCITDIHVDKNRNVHYKVPEEIQTFLTLYVNMTQCLAPSHDLGLQPVLLESMSNISILCTLCNDSYSYLNDHYNSVSDQENGEVCMDIVDMMNYTRKTWSVDLNCSHRHADTAYVLIITIVVGISPLLFYLPLRYTSKEKIMRVFKQKRLTASENRSSRLSSTTVSFAGGDSNGRRQTPLTALFT